MKTSGWDFNEYFIIFFRLRPLSILFIVTLFNQNPLKAQEPLLLESLNLNYDYLADSMLRESTTTYAYDLHSRLINKTRKGPDLCSDCQDYIQSQLASETENWTFNSKGKETSYSKILKLWRKNEPQNPWKLETSSIFNRSITYFDDTLVSQRVEITEYPTSSDWQTAYTNTITETFEYDNQGQKTRHTTLTKTQNGSYASGSLRKETYEYADNLLVYETNSSRSFSATDTIDYTNTAIHYDYETSKLLSSIESDYDFNGSTYRSRQLIYYNGSGKISREESYYWNITKNDWALSHSKDYLYSGTGALQKTLQKSLVNGDSYNLLTIEYNESGKQVLIKEELYDLEMVFIKENYHTIIEWVNDNSSKTTYFGPDMIYYYANISESTDDGRPLITRFETQNFRADSSFLGSSLLSYIYEYDNGGDLIKLRETRVAYDPDSLIAVGCCGWLYEAETFYTNRCDGVPTQEERTQYNYIPGTESEINPYPIKTRQLKSYTPALCEPINGDEIMTVIYPNPTSGSLNIVSHLLSQADTRLMILTTDGKMVRQLTTPITLALALDMSTITTGIYIIRLENGQYHDEERVVVIR